MGQEMRLSSNYRELTAARLDAVARSDQSVVVLRGAMRASGITLIDTLVRKHGVDPFDALEMVMLELQLMEPDLGRTAMDLAGPGSNGDRSD